MKKFNLADLNKRITIQRPAKTSDAMGGFSTSWVNAFSSDIWAAIWPRSAKQGMLDEKNTSEISHRIRIRYRRGIKSSYRIKYKSRYFSIYSEPINPEEANEWLDMLCKEVV